MTVMPGSLDYLYYNGVLDHIPYEAYEMTPGNYNNPLAQSLNMSMPSSMSNPYMQQPMMNGSQYLDAAMSGNAYKSYNMPDTFTRNNNNYMQENPEQSFRDSLIQTANKTKNAVGNTPSFMKGILAGGIMAGTLFCLLKGKKKPPVEEIEKTGFNWSKLNPLKWFKKSN